MATVAITPTSLVTNTVSGDLPIAGGTAIVAANTNTFAYPKEGKLLIVLNNTFAGSKDFTFSAGEFDSSGVGALTIAMAQDDVRYIVLESSRFKDKDGNVSLTYAAATTGFVQAFYLP